MKIIKSENTLFHQPQKINIHQNHNSFKGCIVTLTKQNMGEATVKEVVDVFNKNIFKKVISGMYSKGLSDSVNFFIPAGGKGSRLTIAQAVGNYNKSNLPFSIDNKQNIHVLDFIMAIAKPFSGKNGVEVELTDNPQGSLSEIINYYSKNPIKDTLICNCDTLFKDSALSILEPVIKSIKNKDIHIALVGAKVKPQETAGQYGVVVTDKLNNDIFIRDFVEKPDLQTAEKISRDGINIVSTGFIYLSKDVISKLIEELNSGINNMKKNDIELFDIATTLEYCFRTLNSWFKTTPDKATRVHVSDFWQDVGDNKGFYQFARGVMNGEFLNNFNKHLKNKIQHAFCTRCNFSSNQPYINFSKNKKVSQKQLNTVNNINGLKILK